MRDAGAAFCVGGVGFRLREMADAILVSPAAASGDGGALSSHVNPWHVMSRWFASVFSIGSRA